MGSYTGIEKSSEHLVDFYVDDTQMAARVGSYLTKGYRSGEVMVLIATPDHRAQIEAVLSANGLDVPTLASEGTLVHADASETLGRLTNAGQVVPERFDAVVGGLLGAAMYGGRRACAYGEMVHLLWERGLLNQAVVLESLWNELGHRLPFSLYCTYRSQVAEGDPEAVRSICDLHTEVVNAAELERTAQGTCEAHFPNSPEAVRSVRMFVAEALGRWSMSYLLDAALLVATELGTNAIRHASSPFRIELDRRQGRLRIACWDSGSGSPRKREAAPDATSGRGIAVIEALSCGWGWELRAGEKEVWAELAV